VPANDIGVSTLPAGPDGALSSTTSAGGDSLESPSAAAPLRHSGLGITSLVCSLTAAALLLALAVLLAGFGSLLTSGSQSADPPLLAAILLLGAGLCLDSFALGVGVGAVVQAGRKRLFAVVGVASSGLVALLFVAAWLVFVLVPSGLV
jgi:hypothetical protein